MKTLNRFYFFNFVFFSVFIQAQTLPSARSTDWTLAGLRDTTYPNNVQVFNGIADGVTDNHAAFTAFINGLTLPALVQFEAGVFLFNNEIELPSDLVIRGKGAGLTTLKFDLDSASLGCIVVNGSEFASQYYLTTSANKEDVTIPVTGTPLVVGDYVRFIQDDTDLITDSWSERRTGQVSQVTAVSASSITLASPLRMDFPLSRNPRIRRMNPKKNIGIECLTIDRVDQIAVVADRNDYSKIKLRYTVNSWVKGVESINCNYAHFEALYSANLLVSGCYFHDAFEDGGDGRAYGAMLHFATSESKVENTIFKSLRHAMIVQAGANGNVFAYNYSTLSKKDGASTASEDMMCHGNYAYLNLFEGNVAEWAKVDASHGENGSYNTFYRNRTTGTGFSVTSGFIFPCFCSVDNSDQNFIGNEGSQAIGGTGHQIDYNSWQSTSGTLETSLAYASKPNFLTDAQFGQIGFGYFNTSASNPAADRYASNNFIDAICGTHVWDGSNWENNFLPDHTSQFYNLTIEKGLVVTVNSDISVNAITLNPGARFEMNSANVLTLTDSVLIKASDTDYAQLKINQSIPAKFEMVWSHSGWHHINAPLITAPVSQIENQIKVYYNGNINGPSLFTWSPNSPAEYVAVANNTANLGANSYNIFVDQFLVKSGKGIYRNGQLPVKITLKGMLNNGPQINNSLGYGTAANVTGLEANGWNLMRNPFSTNLDLDVVFTSVPSGFEIGAHVFNPNTGLFEVRTIAAINNGNSTSIAPGQSFFVKLEAGADLNSGFYNFNNAVKSISMVAPFYKKPYDGFDLTLRFQSKKINSARIYFLEGGTNTYQAATDISVFYLNQAKSGVAVEKLNGNNLQKLSVAGYSLENKKNIPLSVFANEKGMFTLSAENKAGNHNLYLLDAQENIFKPLHKDVQISLKQGWNSNRFSIHFSDSIVGLLPQLLNAWVSQNQLKVVFVAQDQEVQLHLYSVSGKEVWQKSTLTQKGLMSFNIPSLSKGVYLLSIQKNGETCTTKLFL